MKANGRLFFLIVVLLLCAAATTAVILSYRPPHETTTEHNYNEWLTDWRRKIRVIAGEGRYSEAERLLRNYLNYAPDDNEMRRLLGKLLFDGGNRSGALKAYYAILLRDPGDFIARNNFAVALVGDRRLDEAVREFADAYEASGHEGFIGLNLVGAYALSGAEKAARELTAEIDKQYHGRVEVPFDALMLGGTSKVLAGDTVPR